MLHQAGLLTSGRRTPLLAFPFSLRTVALIFLLSGSEEFPCQLQ
jgi:hypothetical protein